MILFTRLFATNLLGTGKVSAGRQRDLEEPNADLFWLHGVTGLFFTYLGLYLMNGHGQPALLYLVPCTLGTTITFPLFNLFMLQLSPQVLIDLSSLECHIYQDFVSYWDCLEVR